MKTKIIYVVILMIPLVSLARDDFLIIQPQMKEKMRFDENEYKKDSDEMELDYFESMFSPKEKKLFDQFLKEAPTPTGITPINIEKEKYIKFYQRGYALHKLLRIIPSAGVGCIYLHEYHSYSAYVNGFYDAGESKKMDFSIGWNPDGEMVAEKGFLKVIPGYAIN